MLSQGNAQVGQGLVERRAKLLAASTSRRLKRTFIAARGA